MRNCMYCRVKTKPLSKAVIEQAQQILTGSLQPIGGARCLCHQKGPPITREMAMKKLRKDIARMGKTTKTG